MLAATTIGLKRSTIPRARFEYRAYSSWRPGRNTAFGARSLASRMGIPECTPNARAS
jgi:hypothetical protein